MVYVRTSEGTCKLRKCCHTPLYFSLFPFYFFSLIFFSLSASLLPQVFPLLQLNAINDLHLRLIQTLFLHLSHSTPLHKTLTINYFLRIEYFQHSYCALPRVMFYDAFKHRGGNRSNVTQRRLSSIRHGPRIRKPIRGLSGKIHTFTKV